MYYKLVRSFALLLILISFKVSSQGYKISIERITTNEKIFYGSIGDKYDITLYLKALTFSEDHLDVYSVKGWYYYNSVKKNIPVVGIYNPINGLTLYALKDKALEEKIATFNLPGDTVWDKIEYVNSIKEYEEKFTMTEDTEAENKWKNKTKELGFKIYNFNNESIVSELVFLKLDKNKTISLNDLHIGYPKLEIINTIKTKSETKILLDYEYYANSNLQGRCGAAMNNGYIILSFNSKNELNFIDELITEDCMNSIYSEEIISNNKDLIQFKIIDSSGDKETEKKITINTKVIAFSNEKQHNNE